MAAQTTISEDLANLFQKTAEANKVFMKESANFVRNLASSKTKGADLLNSQAEVFREAFNVFVKLNIQHTSNLIDLGVAISRKINESAGSGPGSSGEDRPAFVLNVAGVAGQKANTQFLLDSDKKETVTCTLTNSEYVSQEAEEIKKSFPTVFSPQSFRLAAGGSQKVEISIDVPVGTSPGVYLSHVTVEGFQHTYFSLYVNVSAPQENPPGEKSAPAKSTTRKRKGQ